VSDRGTNCHGAAAAAAAAGDEDALPPTLKMEDSASAS
jgi:hypothetical protein